MVKTFLAAILLFATVSLASAHPNNGPSNYSYGTLGGTGAYGGTSVTGQGQPYASASSQASTYGSVSTHYNANGSTPNGSTTDHSTSSGWANNDASYGGGSTIAGFSGGYTYSTNGQY